MYYDLTRGKISRSLILFALPMGAGALFSIYQGQKDLSSLKLSIMRWHTFSPPRRLALPESGSSFRSAGHWLI